MAWNSSRETTNVVLNVGRSAALSGTANLIGEPMAVQAADAKRVALALGPQPVYLQLDSLSAAELASVCPPAATSAGDAHLGAAR